MISPRKNSIDCLALLVGGMVLALALPASALLKPAESLSEAGVHRIGEKGDDDTAAYILSKRSFSFYGQTYKGLTVSTNGWITMGDTGNTLGVFDTLTPLPNNPAGIIVNGDDWVQTDAGVKPKGYVYYKVYNDSVAVTWVNVPHFSNFDGDGPRSTFQAVLFNNGGIGLAYGDLGGSNGTLVGLNSGNGQHYTTLDGPAAGEGTYAENDFALNFANKEFYFSYEGANYVVTGAAGAIPEPAIPAVLGVGGVMWWWRRRRVGS